MRDDTYEFGSLNEGISDKLEIQRIEVWGLGDTEALIEQEKYRNEKNEERRKAGSVDVQKMFGDGFSKEHLLQNTFKHRENVGADTLDEMDQYLSLIHI